MRAGKLRHPVVIERRLDVSDGQGGVTRTWVPWRITWAAVEPLTGNEALLAGQMEAKVTHRVRIRYPGSAGSPIRHTMRVLHEGREFNVRSVIDPNENHRELHLMCDEFVGLPVNA